jgi:hypothetical protein
LYTDAQRGGDLGGGSGSVGDGGGATARATTRNNTQQHETKVGLCND